MECKACGSKLIRNTKLVEIINVFGTPFRRTFNDIKLDVDVNRCNICGSYTYTKKPRETVL
jgi:rRNA maturation endonuclease Nob1